MAIDCESEAMTMVAGCFSLRDLPKTMAAPTHNTVLYTLSLYLLLSASPEVSWGFMVLHYEAKVFHQTSICDGFLTTVKICIRLSAARPDRLRPAWSGSAHCYSTIRSTYHSARGA